LVGASPALFAFPEWPDTESMVGGVRPELGGSSLGCK
jgi:hypothetical protein